MTGHLPEVSLFEAAMEGEASPSLDPEVAVHLTTCDRCQRRLQSVREDLATVGTRAGTTSPPPALRASILAAVAPGESAEPFPGLARRVGKLFDLDAEATRKVLQDARGDTAWTWTGPVSFFHFTPGPSLAGSAEGGIIRLAPGAVFPGHRHRGDEHGFILSGALREDQSGREAFPGDLVFMPEGSVHTVTCISREPCTFAVLLHGGFPIFQ